MVKRGKKKRAKKWPFTITGLNGLTTGRKERKINRNEQRAVPIDSQV